MKKKLRDIRTVFRQILILTVLGFCVFELWRIVRHHAVVGSSLWDIIRYLSYFTLVIYVLTVVYTGVRIFHNYGLRRFEPGNPESLKQLAKLRQYRLNSEITPILKSPKSLPAIQAALSQEGYQMTEKFKEFTIYERDLVSLLPWRPKRKSRIFLVVRKDTNVIAVDNLLLNISDITARKVAQIDYRVNYVLLAVQMTELYEAYSVGAGIVNYLSDETGNYLLPLMLEVNHGLIFYPEDKSTLSLLRLIDFRNFRGGLCARLRKFSDQLRETPKQTTSREVNNGK